MSETQGLSRGQDYIENIARMLGDLQGTSTVVYELLQNADDAPGATRVRFTVMDDVLEVWNDGVFDKCEDVTSSTCAWLLDRQHRCDFHSFRTVGSGDKQARPGTTGAFGIGFTAVYQLTDRPELISNGEHWFVEEMADQDDRIQRSTIEQAHRGTTLRLPWAASPSLFRKRLKQEPISEEAIRRFPTELRECVLGAMLFLKKIVAIEIVTDDSEVCFERQHNEDSITLTSTDGLERRWLLLRGDFNVEAGELKSNHPDLIEAARSSEVSIAIPAEQATATGLLYATLPTEESIPLPLLVNADFYPASDRKSIRFDAGAFSEWNREAVRAAARLLASNLELLPESIGDKAVVTLLRGARELHARVEASDGDGTLASFWREIRSVLPDSAIVPTTSDTYGTPRKVRLWSELAESESSALLHHLGIDLVSPAVRPEWHQMRSTEVGIENLHLRDVVTALSLRGVSRRWSATSPVAGLDSDSAGYLWRLVDLLLSVKDRSDEQSRTLLQRCALAPGSDGAFWPLSALHRVDPSVREILFLLGSGEVLLDDPVLLPAAPRLAELVPFARPNTVVELMESALVKSTSLSPAIASRILSWLHANRSELDRDHLTRVAALPIFPTAQGPRPLSHLALPGDFTDPLALASIVALDGIEEIRPFLEQLGARRLTLPTYCIDFLAPVLAGSDLVGVQRERAVRLLARRLNEVRSDQAVKDALAPLALVVCTDGQWRAPDEVYLRHEVSLLVGDHAAIAVLPTLDREAHAELFAWLGAETEPRPRDLEFRCKSLATGGPNHREIAQAIIGYSARCFANDIERAQVDFAGLRDINWLPIEGDVLRGHRPGIVWLRFRKNLFSSQAKFLDIAQGVEQDSRDFLRWLGLEQEPTSAMVVAHLLERVDHGEPVGEDMWLYLDQHADDPALDELTNKRCLLLQETMTYVRPDQVYWGPHEFGRWRHTLGESFSKHRRLLERLEVPEGPAPEDAIEVLFDIAARHAGEAGSLINDDSLVVRSCWRLLSTALLEGSISPELLVELVDAEVVLDAAGQPRRPTDVYFRDSVSLAERFGEEVRPRLIDRPEGMWEALAAAGVTNLSDAVTTSVVEQVLLGDGGMLPQRLKARERTMVRVLAKEDPDAAIRLGVFVSGDHLQRVGALTIQQAIEIDHVIHTSAPFERDALFLRDQCLLLWVDRGVKEPSWLEVARELVRAIEVEGGSAASVTAVIKGALSAPSTAEAEVELDELGYPALDRRTEGTATPGVSEGLAAGDGDLAYPEDEDEIGGTIETAGPESATEPRCETESAEPGESENDEPPATNDSPVAGTSPKDEGTQPRATDQPTEHGPGATPSQARQNRLRSYVVPKSSINESISDEPTSEMDLVDSAAIAAALAYEHERGRIAFQMPHDNPGYDIRSEHPDGEVRFIEVKGTAVRWGEQGVAISSRQYFEAQHQRENFWLYVVDQSTTTPHVHAIQDPVSMIDQYFFDDGWRVVSEQTEAPRPPLPALRLPTNDPGAGVVALREEPFDSALPGDAWVPCTDPKRRDDWFAVRVPGYSLGLANRGAVVFVEPLDRPPEDDDLLVVSLNDQIDPDTGTGLAIRLWLPETDLQGNVLAIRLWSTYSVAPLTVQHPEQLIVHGQVMGRPLSMADLERLGLL